MSFATGIRISSFSTSSVSHRRLNEFDLKKIFFGRLKLQNKRHLPEHKAQLFRRFEKEPSLKYPTTNYGCRGTGIRHEHGWEHVPELVPQIIVPDLKGFALKPYVSYRAKDVTQEELTAKDLFNAVYGSKIVKDFKAGLLREDGTSMEPNAEEELTPEEAYIAAKRSGSDVFQGGEARDPRFKLTYQRH
eukprot:TRINITY_DN2174_c0_g1_i1.p1 TRINITY_DN2174_c0_g1~~TRINITY_DN2174_c0_g1_i1.p1  ORF type:complete len:189 (+),score=46.60 TRINITY_DN2174_c0_g1_i1:37-603(+)